MVLNSSQASLWNTILLQAPCVGRAGQMAAREVVISAVGCIFQRKEGGILSKPLQRNCPNGETR